MKKENRIPSWDEFIYESQYIGEYKILIKPLTYGKWGECYENARLEYFEQKKKNVNVKYCVGHVDGLIKSPITKTFIHMPSPLHHAWVLIDDKYISDPTPFKYGNTGDTASEPEEMAGQYFKKAVYKCLYVVDENELNKPLSYFPSR